MILAIDPGPEQCGVVLYDADSRRVMRAHVMETPEVLESFGSESEPLPDDVVIEMVASYGLPVGAEVFETCVVIGRLMAACEPWVPAVRIFRKDVKLHLCGSARAKDSNVRQALLDKFGGKAKAIGNKANPGPLHGVRSHCWAALALAVTFAETRTAAK